MAKKSLCYANDGDVMVRRDGAWCAIPPTELVGLHPTHLNFQQPNRYFGSFGSGSYSGDVVTVDKLYGTPFVVSRVTSPDSIGLYISGGLAGKLRLGLYTDDGLVWPKTRLFDSGELDTAVAAAKTAVVSGVTLQPHTLYWLVSLFQSACSAWVAPVGYSNNTCLGCANPNQDVASGTYEAFAFAALPATFPKTPTYGVGASMPLVMVRLP